VNLDLQQILTQILGFLLLLGLMRKFAWKPLLSVLDERREKIVHDLEQIERRQHEVDQLREAYRLKMAEAHNQAQITLHQAVLDGAQQVKQMLDEARRQAQQVLEKSQRDVAQEVMNGRMRLRNEIAEIAVLSAGRILQQEIDASRNQTLVLTSIDQIELSKKSPRPAS